MDIWIFNIITFGLVGLVAGYAYSASERAANAQLSVATAIDAIKNLSTDIDSVDERFDRVYSELERHEKTFARSRRSRSPKAVSEKATTAPKTDYTPSVNNYMTEGGA